MMGQMMEPVQFPEPIDPRELPPKTWILDGAEGRPSRIIRSLLLDPAIEEELNWKLMRKYEMIAREVIDAETYQAADARFVVIAYGTAARIAKGAIKRLREMGLKVGLFRPITLWPFPSRYLGDMSRLVGSFLVFEMSTGQMLEDVRLGVEGKVPISFYGRMGGVVPMPEEVLEEIQKLARSSAN